MQNPDSANTGPVHPVAATLHALLALANQTEREASRSLGLNLTDYRALTVLAESGPITVGALAAEMGATAATTTAVVSRLEAHALVERLRGTEDRRHVHVAVTEDASGRLAALAGPVLPAASAHLEGLAPEHQRVMGDFLNDMKQLMEQHLQTLAGKESL
ncbi:MarR family transcriptional regulator [Paenarthrobacter ilicis]|uniref:MarR family winged helix-turn-helix transcriptional regulator n=1 Tax=Paenarthrobacter ilicis TaxID=43665 RepID=UPI0028D5F953|nr:MarR family transcriptional regulator [Paenarthrobacter ilicis]